MEDYTYEPLSESIWVCVTKAHRFGTDAFLLADFAAPRHKDAVCDLGTGCGIIPLVMEKHFSPRKIYGIELQEAAVKQFELGIEKSGLPHKITAVCADFRELPGGLNARFDVVTCNPPYKAKGGGILSETAADRIARHETMCTLPDVCTAAAKLLKFGGRLCICQRPERLADAICEMRASGIEPKRLRLVAKDEKSRPWLFLLEGRKGAKPYMTHEPLLIIKSGDGFSQELMEIYNGRRAGG